MRALAALVLASTLVVGLVPGAAAAVCALGACAYDDAYRDARTGCDGTWRVTGFWLASSDLSLYAVGEDRRCPDGYGGGKGLRAGVVLFTFDAEARWYEPEGRDCATDARVLDFDAGADCLAGPPPLPWGDVLP